MKNFLTLILTALALVACTPRAIIVRPIADQAAVTAGEVNLTADKAEKVKKGTAQAGQNVKDLQAEITKAQAEAERLRKAGQATKSELAANAKAWDAVAKRNAFLEASMQQLIFDTSELSEIANSAKAEAARSLKQAKQSDKAQRELIAENAALKPDADLGRTVRRWFWGIVITLILALITAVVLAVMKRAAAIASKGVLPL